MSTAKFWQEVYIAAIRSGQGYSTAVVIADEAVEKFNSRMNRGELRQ